MPHLMHADLRLLQLLRVLLQLVRVALAVLPALVFLAVGALRLPTVKPRRQLRLTLRGVPTSVTILYL